jgi:VWFA-related protein
LTRASSAIVFSALLLCRPLAGQAPTTGAADHLPVIRTTTTEVLVDLVARDKRHHSITDLRPEEVEVYEDGVRQKVKVFRDVQGVEQLQTERIAEQVEAANSGSTSGHRRNTLRQLNFVTVVLGSIAQTNAPFAREAVPEFLKGNNLPNTYVTIYRLNHILELIQPYTGDKEALASAVGKGTKGLYVNGGLGTLPDVASASLAAAQAAVTNATTVPTSAAAASSVQSGNMLAQNPLVAIVQDPQFAQTAAAQDASVGLGNALLTQAHLAAGMRFIGSEVDGMNSIEALHELVRSGETLPGRKVVLYLADGLTFPVNRREVVDGLISYANRAGVAFYTIDTRGLSVDDANIPAFAALKRANAESLSNAANPRVGHHEDDDIQLSAVSNSQLAMIELAESTGGFAVTNTNQIAAPMQRMMEDMRTHYELAYTPSSTKYDGHFRRIEVKIARPKVTVQTRKGYYALPELNGEPLQPFEMVALNAINAYPAPEAFRYEASLLEFSPKGHDVTYLMAFEVPVSGLKAATDPKTGKAHVQASMVALIHNANGEIVAKISRDLSRPIYGPNVAQFASDRILYAEPVDLPKGRYVIDTAVTDEEAGKSAVKRISVFVNPGKDLGVSSLEVVSQLMPRTGPRNPFNPFELDTVRILPTLADSVASGKPVDLYFIVYPAKLPLGESPKVTLQMFRDGKEVARQNLDLPKPEPDGSIPVLLQLSPAPGQCDILVTAQQGMLVAESNRSLKVQ